MLRTTNKAAKIMGIGGIAQSLFHSEHEIPDAIKGAFVAYVATQVIERVAGLNDPIVIGWETSAQGDGYFAILPTSSSAGDRSYVSLCDLVEVDPFALADRALDLWGNQGSNQTTAVHARGRVTSFAGLIASL